MISFALAVVVMLTTAAYLPGVLDPTISGRWAVLLIGSACLLLLVRRPLLGPGHAWGGALVAWAALGLLWSASPWDTTGELIHWAALAVLFLVASQCRDPDVVLTGLVIGLCASVPFAIAQMTGATPVLATDAPAGLFLSRNAMGEVAACALTWTIARRAWPLVPAPLLLVAVSGSRGAVLACVTGGVVILWQTGLRWMILVIVAPLLAFAAIITAWRDPSLASVLARVDIWQVTAMNLTFSGWGLDTFSTLIPGFGYVHDDYLQLAFELGVGSLLLGPPLLLALRSGVPEAGALASILGAALVSFPSHHPTGAMLVALLAGLCCGAIDRSRRAERVLGMGSAVRTYYEHDGSLSPADLRRVGPLHYVLADGQEHAMGGGALAPDVRADTETAQP
jgi:hypothetical protein